MKFKSYLGLYRRNFFSRIIFHALYYFFAIVFSLAIVFINRSNYYEIPSHMDDFYSPLRIMSVDRSNGLKSVPRSISSASGFGSFLFSDRQVLNGEELFYTYEVYPFDIISYRFKDVELVGDEVILFSTDINYTSNIKDLDYYIVGQKSQIEKTVKIKYLYSGNVDAVFVSNDIATELIKYDNFIEPVLASKDISFGAPSLAFYNIYEEIIGKVGVNKYYIRNSLAQNGISYSGLDFNNVELINEFLKNFDLNLYDRKNNLLKSNVELAYIPSTLSSNICKLYDEESSCMVIPREYKANASSSSNSDFYLFDNVNDLMETYNDFSAKDYSFYYSYASSISKIDHTLTYVLLSCTFALLFSLYICAFTTINKEYIERDNYLLSHDVKGKNIMLAHILYASIFLLLALLLNIAVLIVFRFGLFYWVGKFSITFVQDYFIAVFSPLLFFIIEILFTYKDLGSVKNENKN